MGDPEAPTSERCISARAGDEQIPLAERRWEGGPTEAQPLPPPPRTDEASLKEPDSGPRLEPSPGGAAEGRAWHCLTENKRSLCPQQGTEC